MLANIKEIGATLKRNKTRTLLTAFGIFWGTAMLTLLMGGGAGLQAMLYSNFEGFATNSAAIMPSATTMPYKGYQKGRSWTMKQKDIDMMRAGIPELGAISPFFSINTTVRYADRNMVCQMQGVDDNYLKVQDIDIIDGRFVSTVDFQGDRKVCVIGIDMANQLFGGVSPIGKFVEADNVYYRVVGVARQKSEININGRVDESIIIPQSTMGRTYNLGDNIYGAMIVAADGHTPKEIIPRIQHIVCMNHNIDPADEHALEFFDISENFAMIDNLFIGVRVLILFVGLSSLLAGVIGVGNIMWIVVKERTKEFGIRRAIGAKPRTVLFQIISESVVLTVVAGLFGICFSVLVLSIVTRAVAASGESADFMITFGQAIVILILFVVLGTAAGTIPALKAMRIRPIEALNSRD